MLRVAAAAYDTVMSGVEQAGLLEWRAALLADLTGSVLEVGAGTGRNLPLYPPGLDRLVLSEPDPHMRHRLSQAIERSRIDRKVRGDVDIVDAPVEKLPFDDRSFDAVVCTLVLCSVPDQAHALGEMRRVLVEGGRLVFIEHVAASGQGRQLLLQRCVEPLWRRVAGNCHLTRATESEILAAGFELPDVTHAPMPKSPSFVRPTIHGVAMRPLGSDMSSAPPPSGNPQA